MKDFYDDSIFLSWEVTTEWYIPSFHNGSIRDNVAQLQFSLRQKLIKGLKHVSFVCVIAKLCFGLAIAHVPK